MPNSSVNKRILSEIESLQVEENIKGFLKTIVEIELDNSGNMKRERPRYLDQYKQKMEEIFKED